MAGFIPHIIENRETEALYHIPATDNKTYKIGQALSLSSGKVTPDVTGVMPEYLCRTDITIPSGGSGIIACTPLRADIIYETVVGTKALSSSAAGTAVGIDTTSDDNGMTVTDDTSSEGIFEIVEAAGTTAGNKVLVRLLK